MTSTRLKILFLFLSIFGGWNSGISQKRINIPKVVKVTPQFSDVRSWANTTNGQVLSFQSDSWSNFGTCWYWGLKDTLQNVINGANNQPPNMSCSGMNRLVLSNSLSKPDSGRLVFTGNTNYKYLTSSNTNSFTTKSIPVRLTVNLFDNSNNFIGLTRFDSGYFIRANSDYNVRLLLEAYGPSDALNCASYGSCNKWIPAILLFDYLHTDPYTSICTSLNYSSFWEYSTSVTTSNLGPYCENEKIKLQAKTTSTGFWTLNSDTVGKTKDVTINGISDTEKFKFTAVGKYGCQDTSFTTVIIYPKPHPLFSINDSTQCLKNNAFFFTNNSFIANGNLKFNWKITSPANYKDTLTNFDYSLTKPGKYGVQLICTSEKNCNDSTSKNIYVYDMPNFTVKIDSTCIYDSVKLAMNLGLSKDSIDEIQWQLPNDNFFYESSFKHKFSSSGINQIVVSARTNRNCLQSDTILHPVFSKPKANFTTVPASNFCSGDTIRFNSASKNDYGKIKLLSWNFGDKNNTFDSTVKKSYSVKKTTTYNVRLFILGEANCKDSIIKTVDIEEKPRTCLVSAKTDYKTYYYGVNVQPKDSIGNIGGQNNVDYSFIVEGIGTIKSSGINANALFQLPSDGTYKIKVKAQNSLGAKCICESDWYNFTINRLSQNHSPIHGLSIFPNPTESILYLQNTSGFKLEIWLRLPTGEIVQHYANVDSVAELDVSNLSVGIYEIHAQHTHGYSVLKFIKI